MAKNLGVFPLINSEISNWKKHLVLIGENSIFMYFECNYCEKKYGIRINRSYHQRVKGVPRWFSGVTNVKDIEHIKKHLITHGVKLK